MKIFVAVYDNGRKIEEVDSKELKRLGSAHVCPDYDIYARYKQGCGYYGSIYEFSQLFLTKESAQRYWNLHEYASAQDRADIYYAING